MAHSVMEKICLRYRLATKSYLSAPCMFLRTHSQQYTELYTVRNLRTPPANGTVKLRQQSRNVKYCIDRTGIISIKLIRPIQNYNNNGLSMVCDRCSSFIKIMEMLKMMVDIAYDN